MPWNDADELVVGGTGEVYIAPVGTTFPTTPTGALDAAWVGLGYHDEDGATFGVDPDITEFRAWQSRQAVRRELTGQAVSVTFKLEQWNENNVVLAFGGGAVTTVSAGIYKYTPPSGGDALAEKAMVLDVQDGTEHWRFLFPRGNAAEAVSSDFKRSELAILPITFRALAPTADPNGPPFNILTDSDAFAAGS